MIKHKSCKFCEKLNHFSFQCWKNPKNQKKINKISIKQSEYHTWLKQVARPYLILKYGNVCNCCKKHFDTKLDIDHIKGIGSNPSLKKDLNNLQFLCRFPCHRRKTDHISCIH